MFNRLVQCSDPGISAVPINVPADTVKLRLEKTLITTVPRAAFYNLSVLRFLWLTYNSIISVHPSSFVNLKALRELRLDGNLLTSFPWEALRDMPQLQTLGLHNNRLSSLPAHAALFLPNITYLDLSSNRWVHMPPSPCPSLFYPRLFSFAVPYFVFVFSDLLYYLLSCWTFGSHFQDKRVDPSKDES